MIISGRDLSKSYGKLKVLDNVTISCAAGEICGLLGANGAGKTTLFKILFGLVTPDTGTVKINTNSVKPIGGIIEKPALYEYLNAWDNLKIFGRIQGIDTNHDFLAATLTNVGLPLDRKDPVRNFSMGMKQRLGIAIALLNSPACLVLDEPFTGLDPLGVAALRKLIVDLAEKENLAIILSSHIIEELSKICNTLYVLKEGRIVNTGAAQKLIADNTSTYNICAENISSSQSLKAYQVSFKGNYALVSISTEMVPGLIQQLYEERIYITSCSPELSMEKLFENLYNMKALIIAEVNKLFKQSKTYYALGCLFLIEAIVLFSAYYQGSNIIDILLENLRKSFYFKGSLLNGNLLIYLILNTLWFHLPLILMIIVSGSLTSEYKDRTIQTVMLQPISKWKFILSKYVVAIAFTILVVFLMAITSFALSYGIFGKGDLIVYLNTLNFFESKDAFHRLQLAFVSGTLSMIFFSVVSLTIAVIFKEATKTWIVAAFFLIFSNILLKVEFSNYWVNRLFFAKLNDTWQYFFYYKIEWKLIYENSILLVAYTLLFMLGGIYLFNKKDIG